MSSEATPSSPGPVAPVIEVQGLSKRFRLGESHGADSFREALSRAVLAPFRRLRGREPSPVEADDLWALRDVSFRIDQGEVVGVIGHNGAGKSTLLKILARVTRPTEGSGTIRGRVGSLLEIGTGFHPELTGAENIYLNGAILGMRRVEIEERFAEIVDFSGLARFLDTPIKRYSSGMRMRLAFSVAAHLDPEVLLVDEALSVGDAEFQKKCLGKMEDVAGLGRTILFVSHNMAAVQNLCSRCLVLEQGELVFDGPVEEAIGLYAGQTEALVSAATERSLEAGDYELLSWSFGQPDGSALRPRQPGRFSFQVRSRREMRHAGVHFQIWAPDSTLLFGLDYNTLGSMEGAEPEEPVTFTFQLDSLPLIPGRYYLRLWFKNMGSTEGVELPRALELEVAPGAVYESKDSAELRRHFGHFALDAKAWSVVGAEEPAAD